MPCRGLTEVFPKADDGSRTRYLKLGKLALYQVSYVRRLGRNSRRESTAPLYPPLAERSHLAVFFAVLAVIGFSAGRLNKAPRRGARRDGARRPLPTRGRWQRLARRLRGGWVLVNV